MYSLYLTSSVAKLVRDEMPYDFVHALNLRCHVLLAGVSTEHSSRIPYLSSVFPRPRTVLLLPLSHYRNAGASSMWTRRGWKLRSHAVEAAIVGVLIGKPRRCSACLGGYTRRSPVSDGSAHITSLTEPTLWPSLLILAHIQW